MTTTTTVAVTVRYFAAARAAAGAEVETHPPPVRNDGRPAWSIELGARDAELAKVLKRCSFLCDGFAVRDAGVTLEAAQIIDVLPPFAGG